MACFSIAKVPDGLGSTLCVCVCLCKGTPNSGSECVSLFPALQTLSPTGLPCPASTEGFHLDLLFLVVLSGHYCLENHFYLKKKRSWSGCR